MYIGWLTVDAWIDREKLFSHNVISVHFDHSRFRNNNTSITWSFHESLRVVIHSWPLPFENILVKNFKYNLKITFNDKFNNIIWKWNILLRLYILIANADGRKHTLLQAFEFHANGRKHTFVQAFEFLITVEALLLGTTIDHRKVTTNYIGFWTADSFNKHDLCFSKKPKYRTMSPWHIHRFPERELLPLLLSPLLMVQNSLSPKSEITQKGILWCTRLQDTKIG